jgi:hypothetical protein
VGIEGEGLLDSALAHHDEGHRVDEAEVALPALEQEVEASLEDRLLAGACTLPPGGTP